MSSLPAAAAILKTPERGGGSIVIAVGSRGPELTRRLRLGSVSTRVRKATEGPVPVYPHVM
jgi:nucleotide-binding universal stress UspA family protein